MAMNLPNKLTIIRIFMAPLFLAALLTDFTHHYVVALILFVAASLTDLIDGKIARKYGLITDFGKFLDPLADKMLTTAAFLGFIQLNLGFGIAWITLIVLAREFLVTSLRLLAAGGGTVIAANIWGKAKTVSQMTAIIVVLTAEYTITLFTIPAAAVDWIRIGYAVLLWISAFMTVMSGIIYLKDNSKFIDVTK